MSRSTNPLRPTPAVLLLLLPACEGAAPSPVSLHDAGHSVGLDAEPADGATVQSGDGALVDAASDGIGDDAEPRADAAGFDGPSEGCELGAAGSFATDQSLDLFGETVYFAQGQDLPAGRYRVEYVDGCMKYNALFTWSVNSKGGADGWWLVGSSTTERVTVLPGVAGGGLFDGYADFEDCVAASQALEPLELEHDGGPLGIWLNDAPYVDNVAGERGRNPKWELTLLVEECPPDIQLI